MPIPPLSRRNRRHLSYASGYLGLGLFKKAAAELRAIDQEGRYSGEYLAGLSDLLLATKQWKRLLRTSESWAGHTPRQPRAWINWAYSLRELDQIVEAKEILLLAERIHPDLDILNYNLACYHCLLGELKEARQRLQRACQKDKTWKEAAATDPDLRALH